MAAKDIITIFISVLAFLLSAYATFVTLSRGSEEERREKEENQRTVRTQITDLLGRLFSTQLEQAKLARDMIGQNPESYRFSMATLNQQSAFLFQEAIYFMERFPNLVTAIDYNSVAWASAMAGDMIVADKYYREAIDAADPGYWKSLATRSYAAFLFMQGRFEEGGK